MSQKYRIAKNQVHDRWRVERAKLRQFAGQDFIDGWEPASQVYLSREEAEEKLADLQFEDAEATWVPVL